MIPSVRINGAASQIYPMAEELSPWLFRPVPSEEALIVSPGNFRSGSGIVTEIGVLPNANPKPAPAAEKEKGRKPDPNLYRIFVNMDVGGFQSIVVDRNQFFVGQAVELTNDGRLVRVSGTALIKCKDAER